MFYIPQVVKYKGRPVIYVGYQLGVGGQRAEVYIVERGQRKITVLSNTDGKAFAALTHYAERNGKPTAMGPRHCWARQVLPDVHKMLQRQGMDGLLFRYNDNCAPLSLDE